MGFNIEEWNNKFNDGNVILSYNGNITSELITNVLETVETKLNETEEKPKVTRKIYNVLVECLQNLYHHLDTVQYNGTIKGEEKFAMFSIKKDGGGYNVSTGNFVKNSKIQLLRDRIEQLNSMSSDQVKDLYKIVLNNEEYSDKGGGGLGMIDIVKRTQSKIEYSFDKLSDEYSFFYFNVNM